MASKNFANREVCDLYIVDYASKKLFECLDYANVTTTEITGEQVFAYGGQGHPKRVPFTGEKGGTLTIETQIQTLKLYSMLSGATIENTAKFLKREVVTAATVSDAVTLTIASKPIEGSIQIFADGDDAGTALTGTYTATETETGAAITETVAENGAATLVANKNYIVYYMADVTGVQKLNIKSTTIPKAFTAYGTTYMKAEDDSVLTYRFIAYKCAPQPTFSLAFSNTGDPATITMTCDLLADDDNNIMDMILEDGADE